MISGEWIRIQHDTPEQLCKGGLFVNKTIFRF